MSETKPTVGSELGAAQVTDVSGGACSPEDIEKIVNGLKQNYEALIEFTSYVIERVNGGNP
jgi:hypothetical protein